ncbi:hypothetical protein [Sphingomicrobium arenosum]|uniref:hypothetical protein n=1 Tax=Sphingomicrobium arenosum TaxID=2233861 RepID=UPI002240F55B|nr:hypothetical protein [Sphingomicrobium arenosum]
MRRGLAFLTTVLLGAAPLGAAPNPYEAARAGTPIMQATVTAAAHDDYRLELALGADAPVWIFLRSGTARDTGASWRATSWHVLTDGVTLTRIGHHEALVADDGGALPREIEIAFTPYEGLIHADYQPAIRLGEDVTALFSDHFTLRPAASIAAVQALGADWTMLPDYPGGHPLVRFEGEDFNSGTRHGDFALQNAAYVFHGTPKPRTSDQLVMQVHPDLPLWLADQLAADIPDILALYAARLGPHEDERPELIVGWGGPTRGTVSLGGSVIAHQIVMRLEGEMLVSPSPAAAAQARQFIAHEAAHFWLGNLVDYGPPGEAWTMEGGADLMALRAAQAVDPAMAARLETRTLRASERECRRLGAGGPLVTAPERGAAQAFYGCGLLFSLLAEAAAVDAGGDFFTFWSGLIARHGGDGTVSVEEWLDHYRAIGGDPATAARIHDLAFNRGVDGPLLDALFAASKPARPASNGEAAS